MTLEAKAMEAVKEYLDWSDEGFPGATLGDLVKMATDYQPERDAETARARAASNLDLLLRGCWDIRAELEDSNVPPEYRQAIYMERMGVRRGRQSYLLMEANSQGGEHQRSASEKCTRLVGGKGLAERQT